MEQWQGKIHRVRQHLRGWPKNTSGQNRKEKKNILNTLDELDKKVENTPLSSNEIDIKQYLNNILADMLREAEIKWYQRAKVKELLEGDYNTKYFQLIANGKYRKTRIFQLPHRDKIIKGDAALKQHINKYYKHLFGPSENNRISLDKSQIDDIPQVSDLENEMLVQLFSEEKV
jgi:hypothetical protein